MSHCEEEEEEEEEGLDWGFARIFLNSQHNFNQLILNISMINPFSFIIVTLILLYNWE